MQVDGNKTSTLFFKLNYNDSRVDHQFICEVSLSKSISKPVLLVDDSNKCLCKNSDLIKCYLKQCSNNKLTQEDRNENNVHIPT